MISYDDFEKSKAAFDAVDVRVGKVVAVDDFPEARKPAYKLTIDFGSEIGIKKSSAQIVALYKKADLVGKQIVCVTNFPPKQIGPFVSEVLTLGVSDSDGNVVLLTPTHKAKVGNRMY
jgi:tRNA-binding protein